MSDRVFPISEREADILHDLGWNSGFGWRDCWDWWHADNDIASSESDETKLRLMSHLVAIRAAVAAAEQLAANILRTQP